MCGWSRNSSGTVPVIRGDRVHLQQVLINLILNAADAMSQQADTSTLTIRSFLTSGGFIQFSVRTLDGGIKVGDEEKIFEPYHTTKQHGLGLGLSVSRSIIVAHGGRLWAENYALGAIFHFTVPPWKDEPDAEISERGNAAVSALLSPGKGRSVSGRSCTTGTIELTDPRAIWLSIEDFDDKVLYYPVVPPNVASGTATLIIAACLSTMR